MNHIFFVDKTIKINDELIKIFNQKSDTIISLDFESHSKLKNLKITHHAHDSYLNTDDKSNVSDTCLNIITNWYKNKKIEPYLKIDGTNLGSFLEVEFDIYLLSKCGIVASLLKIKEKENPEFVYAASEYYELVKEIFECEVLLIKTEKKHRQQYVNDKFSIKYQIGNFPIVFRLPRKYFMLLRKFYEKTVLTMFDLFFTKLDSNKESLLLVDFDPTQFSDLLRTLSKKNFNVILLNRRRIALWNFQAFNIVRKTHSIPLSYEQFLNKSHKNFIKKEIHERKKNFLKMLSDEEPFQKIFSINDKSFWNFIKIDFLNLLTDRIEEIVYELKGSEIFLLKTKPSLMIHFYTVTLQEKSLVHNIIKQKIKFCLLQHGMYGIYGMTQNLAKSNPILGLLPNFENQQIMVWGNIAKEFQLKNGVNEEQLIEIGNIKTDSYFNMIANPSKKGIILVGVSSLNTINYFCQSMEIYDSYEKCFRLICKTLAKIKDRKKIIKLHPGEMTFLTLPIESIIKEIDPSIKIMVGADIPTLINSCDLLITLGFSTLMLEANILQKPTIALLYDPQESSTDPGMGPTKMFYPHQEKEFSEYFTRILNDNALRKDVIHQGNLFVKRYLKNHGKACQKFADEVEKKIRVNDKNLKELNESKSSRKLYD